MKRRDLLKSVLLAPLALIMWPVKTYRKRQAKTLIVSDQLSFADALAQAEPGDTIVIPGSTNPLLSEYKDAPWNI